MRNSLAILAAKTAAKINQISGSGGTALPGLVAKKLAPKILTDLARANFPKGIIVVTGTNGKTTTSRLIASALEANGTTYVHNRAGSNLERGIIAALVEKASTNGHIDAQMGLFEVDEAYMPMVCEALRPAYVVVTNLFRDQLDRYGELDSIATSFKNTFVKLRNTHLFLNADDPLVASLGLEVEDTTKLHYFGINSYSGPKLAHDHTADSIFSPISQEPLLYSQRYFGHIGVYRSKNGDFKRPACEFAVTKMTQNQDGSQSFVVNNTTKPVKMALSGLYNTYNGIAAYSVAKQIGIDEAEITTAFEKSAAAFGRAEQVEYDHKNWLLLLIKNPTGFNQIIQTYLLEDQTRPLWFIINDNLADGRDVSWLWDAAVEDLVGYKGQLVVSGTRAYDMALRLKYAGLANFTAIADISEGLEYLNSQTGKRSQVLVLPTYTAMRELRAELVQKADVVEEHKQ